MRRAIRTTPRGARGNGHYSADATARIPDKPARTDGCGRHVRDLADVAAERPAGSAPSPKPGILAKPSPDAATLVFCYTHNPTTGPAPSASLLVRRFDRERLDTGYRRHRMVSALTLLRTGDSPVDRRDWSYLLLADEIRRASADPHTDLRELLGRMCFNATVSNLDDHPRNHAVIAGDRGWRLSPAFDLTPSPVVALDPPRPGHDLRPVRPPCP